MYRKFLLICCFLFSADLFSYGSLSDLPSKHSLSYEGGDRFGDRVLVYAQARYLSYITSTTFLYRPFIYSDTLTIEFQAFPYEAYACRYHRVFHIFSLETLTEFFRILRDPHSPPTLFILDYFPSDISEWDFDATRSLFLDIPWEDPGFSSYLRKSLSPRIHIPDLRSQDRLNVAIHVRTLSGRDTVESSFMTLPLKHPGSDYHKRQIARVYEWNLRKPLYVFIFSDTKNPSHVLRDFQESFRGKDIVFGIQYLESSDTNYAVQDFFAMQKFDVLIATQSNFSAMASRVGSLNMVFLPVHVQGVYPNARIDRTRVISKKTDWFPYEFDIIFKDR